MKWVAGIVVAGLFVVPMFVLAMVGGGQAAATPPVTTVAGLSGVALKAYVMAAETAQQGWGCTVPAELLGGIGAVESGHGTFGGGQPDPISGVVTPPMLGPVLDGSGVGGNVTPILDTDDGVMDGNTRFDRAVGPMQFLPSTWTGVAPAAGVTDPHSIFDAAVAAAWYLCNGQAADLTVTATAEAAVLRYNRSSVYVQEVMAAAAGLTVMLTPTGERLPPPPVPVVDVSPTCSVVDPTTSGCIWPATAHTMTQLHAAFGGRWPWGIGCQDSHSKWHASGSACDYTVGAIGRFPTAAEREVGWQAAEWLRTYAPLLGVDYIIWDGQIWSVNRADEDWRAYTSSRYDTTSATGGHFDHLHVNS